MILLTFNIKLGIENFLVKNVDSKILYKYVVFMAEMFVNKKAHIQKFDTKTWYRNVSETFWKCGRHSKGVK